MKVRSPRGSAASSTRCANPSATRSVRRHLSAWLFSQQAAGTTADANAALIVDTLWPLVQQGTLSIPRGGYLLRRGRGRIIVEPPRS